MERMGPEALMVRSRIMPQVEAAEYARLEYGYEDIRVVAACLRSDPEEGPAEPSAIGGWVVRAQAWLRGGSARVASGPDDGSGAAELGVLAAVPVVDAGASPEGEPAPVWAIPILAKPLPDHST